MIISTEDHLIDIIKEEIADPKLKKGNGQKQTKKGKKRTKKGNGPYPENEIGVVILEPGNPMRSARLLRRTDFTVQDLPTMWRHREFFWRWTGSYYELTHEETVRAHVWRFLEKAFKYQLNDKGGWELVPFKPKPENVSAVIDALRSVCELSEHTAAPTWLSQGALMPAADELFACANGLLHLPSGKLYPATPDYFCLNASTVAYDPEAKAPLFDAFLVQLLEQDKEAIELLQDWSGYTLSPDTSQQKIMGMIGPKRSGKGTLARILRKMLGESSVAGPTMHSLGEQFGLEHMITKSLAIISDVRIGARTEKATLIERLLTISGEDGVSVPRKFHTEWYGKMPTRIMFMSNELLALTDSSGAFVSRLMMVMLTKSFYGKEDPGLTNKLEAEMPGILNWAIEGYRRLKQRGYFVQPKSSREAIESMETLASPERAFLRDCCQIEPTKQVSKDDLFEAYCEWSDDQGRKDHGNKEWFFRNLLSIVPELKEKRTREDGVREHVYVGIALIELPKVHATAKPDPVDEQHGRKHGRGA
jgi:putative DNA primase/helicase